MSRRAIKMMEEARAKAAAASRAAEEEEEEEEDGEEGTREDEDESDEDRGGGGGKQRGKGGQIVNVFALLGGSDDDDDDDNDDEEEAEEKKEEKKAAENPPVPGARLEAPRGEGREQTTKKKNKKKKSKNKGKKGVGGGSSGEEEVEDGLDEDGLPLYLAPTNDDEAGECIGGDAALNSLMAVERSHLNADSEMRRIFGSAAVGADRQQGRGAAGGGRGGRGGGTRGGGRALRKTMIATPKDNWPPVKHLGISFRLSDSPPPKVPGSGSQGQYFEVHFDEGYMGVQEQYYAMVATHDPQMMADLMRLHPYHIDTLLQMSDYYSQMGEHATAADLIERSVYALELGMNQTFLNALGSVRLDYSVDRNRLVFHCLFRHMQFVGKKGCNRSALEIARLILSLAPDSDPMGMLMCIDYYGLRCRQFVFVPRLADFYSNLPSLHPMHHAGGLPSLRFSKALSLWHTENSEKGAASSSSSSAALELLQSALSDHPSALAPLLEKCNALGTSSWPEILTREPFASASAPETVEHIISIFVERHHTLWKPSPVLMFLQKAARGLCDRLDEGERVSGGAKVRGASHEAAMHYKHILVSNFSDSVTTIPADVMREAQGQDAGMAPMRPARGGAGAGEENLNRLDANTNPLLLFLQSMMPWNAAPVDEDGGEAGADEDAALARRLQQQMLDEMQGGGAD